MPRRARDELARSETAAWCGRGASPRGAPSRWATRVAFDAADLERVERETKRRSGRTLDARAPPGVGRAPEARLPDVRDEREPNPNPSNPPRRRREPPPREPSPCGGRSPRRRRRDVPARGEGARTRAAAREPRSPGRTPTSATPSAAAPSRASTSRPRRSDERRASRRGLANDARTRGRGGRRSFRRVPPVGAAGGSGSSSRSGVGSFFPRPPRVTVGDGRGLPRARGIPSGGREREGRSEGRPRDRGERDHAAVRGRARRTTVATPAAAARARNRPAARLVEEAEL